MSKKRVKAVSFDAMVKFFMLNYDIPSRKDIQKILIKLENMEALIRNCCTKGGRLTAGLGVRMIPGSKSAETAIETVLRVIRSNDRGAGFGDIRVKTGFNERKIRNIIFRLSKLGKIERQRRGIYTVVD